MAGHVVADTDPGLMMNSNMVLVVSRDGAVCSVLSASDDIHKACQADNVELSIDSLWSRELGDILRSYLKRTLRSRQVYCDEIENPSDGKNYEFMFIAQGRNRVLLIVRDVSQQKFDLTRIRQLAYTDEVTSLPNREFLFLELQKIADIQRL
ncbi:MAG: hypothetical protein ACR2QI_06650, partial [Woeseiaceae bacterium]